MVLYNKLGMPIECTYHSKYYTLASLTDLAVSLP